MLDWMLSAISNYGYVALFIAALVEGPIAAVIGAFLASQGLLNIAAVYMVSVLGDMLGDLLLYGLGRSSWMSSSFLRKRPNSSANLKFSSLLASFRTRPGRVLVTAKLTHAAGFIVLLGAGVARIPMRIFLGFNFLATLPKSAVFVLLGFFAGAAYHHIDFYLWLFSCVILAVLVVASLFYIRRMFKLTRFEG
ncbi:DedA family protein [Celerinatantimonas yamalensis]|uniref:VTT domain-containing protein n=1 Tax=Celerinatantimonas yamalensis TaxID=559956 RepID=A0ABW9G8P8_9GAMM